MLYFVHGGEKGFFRASIFVRPPRADRDLLHARSGDRALALAPRNANGFLYRGLAFSASGDIDHAIADYSAAIRLNPNAASAYTYRGLAYASRDQADLAIADFTDAIKQPDSGEAHTY